MNMRTVYQDDRNMVDVDDDQAVHLCIGSFHGETNAWARLEPDEAIALGNALVAAGAEAGAQCCGEGCMDVATEFPPHPLHVVEDLPPEALR